MHFQTSYFKLHTKEPIDPRQFVLWMTAKLDLLAEKKPVLTNMPGGLNDG